MSIRLAASATVILSFGAAVSAQFDVPASQSWTSQLASRTQIRMAQHWATAGKPRAQEQVRQVSPASTTSLTYRPSKSRRQVNLAGFVNKSRTVDPVGSASMARLFASTDVIEAMGVQLAPLGLRIDNVADAYATWWMSAWLAANKVSSDPSRAAAQAVRAQAARGLSADPEIRAASDADKQELAEALLIQAALIGASQEKFGDDAAMVEKLAVATRRGAKASGLDLGAMTLTDEGFRPAG